MALAVVACGLVVASVIPASAEFGPGRPVRIEGYWDRTTSAAEVIGEMSVSTDGRMKRNLGLTTVQAYKPEEEGMQLFRFSSLNPTALVLRGEPELVGRFLAAAPTQKIVALGVYHRGSGVLTLGSVEVE